MKIDEPCETHRLKFQAASGQWPTAVAFLDDQRLAAANRQGDILLWDLAQAIPDEPSADEGREQKQDDKQEGADLPPTRLLAGHANGVTRLAVTGDGRTLISASLDQTVRLWDAGAEATGEAEIVLDAEQRQQQARRKRGDEADEILQAPGVAVPRVEDSTLLTGHQGWVRALGVSGDGRRLISGDDSCLTIVWDLAARQPLAQWHGHSRVWITSAALSPDGETAFTAEYAGRRSSFDVPAAQARLWAAGSGELQRDLLKIWTPKVKDQDRTDSYGYGRAWGELIKRGLVAAQFSPDGSLLAAAQGGETSKGQVLLVDVASGKILRTVSGHQSGACDVRFSADGKHVLSSGRDTTVRICQVEDGKEVAALGEGRGGQFKDWLDGIAVSPDQTQVAAADIAGFVRVWRLA